VPQLKPLAVAVGALYDAHVFSTRQPGEAMSQRNNRVAVRMLDWLFAHPSALIFAAGNDFAWAVRPLNDLIAMLRDPVGATERAWQAQTAQWRALFGHATLLVVVLGLCARKVYGPAVDLYFLASDKLLVDPDRPRAEAVLPELVRRRMLQRMSFAKEDTLAWQMTREIERRAPSGALERLEQGTLRALGTHYARHTQSSRVSAILDVLATHEDRDLAAYAFHVRMLCAVRSGDVAECQRVAATRYDLDPQPGLPPKPGLLALTQEVAGDLLRATLRKGDIVGAEEWLERHAALGIRPSRPAFNGLLTAYARRGDVTSAISLFEDMTAAGTVPDKASYTALIVLFGVRKDAESASRAMRAMRAAGLRADRVAYGALLDAFVESAAWDRVVELYNWLASQPSPELRPMAGAANALLKSHVLRASPLQTVLALFDEMRLTGIQPDARTYSLLLQSAADAGDIEQAEDIFTELERVLPHDPDSQPGGAEMHHFTIMMHTYLRRGEVDTARSYYEEMRQRGIEPNAVTWSILIETYIRADDEDGLLVAAELANRLADEAETPAAQRPVWQRPSIQEGQPLEPIYGPLLAAAARRGDAQEAQRIILLLVNAGTAVSIPFWTMLLDAHRSGGDFAGCDRVWAHIYQQALDMTSANLSVVFGPPSKGLAKATRAVTGFELMGAEPPSSSDHREPARRNLLCLPLSIMLDVLSRSGRHVEVVQLWAQLQRDGFGFDPHNWNHLCVALVRAGRYEEAMRVINDVLAEAGPHDRHPARARRPQQLDSAGGQDGMLLGLGRPDIAAVSQAEGVATPSRPPSRRHQGRGAHDGAVDSYDASQHEESAEPKEDPDPPGELSEMAESLLERAPSYWYPHFDTMQALAGGLDEMRRSVPTRASSDESSVVEQDPRTRYRRLMQTYPRAADQLAEHGLRVQRIEQSYANNEKRAAWAAEAARAARLEE
jgi:pentatricopeptide repeat protein